MYIVPRPHNAFKYARYRDKISSLKTKYVNKYV